MIVASSDADEASEIAICISPAAGGDRRHYRDVDIRSAVSPSRITFQPGSDKQERGPGTAAASRTILFSKGIRGCDEQQRRSHQLIINKGQRDRRRHVAMAQR